LLPQTVYDETEEFLGTAMPDLDQFMEVLGRLYINGFEICDSKMETYGWGVYLAPSVLDHSCQPNCVVSFSGCLLTVEALAPVHSLEEALITYVDPALPGPTRRARLLSNYFFLCGCAKCRHSSDGKAVQGRRKARGRGARPGR
jgi:SET and MYND domain-containing protein